MTLYQIVKIYISNSEYVFIMYNIYNIYYIYISILFYCLGIYTYIHINIRHAIYIEPFINECFPNRVEIVFGTIIQHIPVIFNLSYLHS